MTEPEKPKAPPRDETILQQFGMFGIVLGNFVGAGGVGIGLGWLLWKKAGFPWWTILVMSLLGLYAASYQVIRYQREMNRRVEKQGERR